MIVEGRDVAGNVVTERFCCLRFMPYLEGNENEPVLVQLHIPDDEITTIDGCIAIYPEVYDVTYTVHSNDDSEEGGIVLYGNYLIHDEPDDDHDIYGGAGCIEVCGENGYNDFIQTIMTLTGSDANEPKTNLESIMNYENCSF